MSGSKGGCCPAAASCRLLCPIEGMHIMHAPCTLQSPNRPQGAALLCLWPLGLAVACPARYARWREFLIPMHLAVQHWIGLHFASPLDAHAPMVRAGWFVMIAETAGGARAGRRQRGGSMARGQPCCCVYVH